MKFVFENEDVCFSWEEDNSVLLTSSFVALMRFNIFYAVFYLRDDSMVYCQLVDRHWYTKVTNKRTKQKRKQCSILTVAEKIIHFLLRTRHYYNLNLLWFYISRSSWQKNRTNRSTNSDTYQNYKHRYNQNSSVEATFFFNLPHLLCIINALAVLKGDTPVTTDTYVPGNQSSTTLWQQSDRKN
jgi:hypothetical protein